MFKLIKRLGVCALVLGLQGGLSFAVSAAPINDTWQQTDQQAWSVQDQERQALSLRQQEVWRHDQAMQQRVNESMSDWQWRQWQEHEQHNRNMQNMQYPLQVDVTQVNW